MKKFKFISFLFLMIISLGILCSCSNEQGPVGPQGEQGIQGEPGQNGQDGKDGQDGRSVVSITLTSSNGNVDTYTITYSDGTTSTFTVTNGVDGQNGSDGAQGPQGEQGIQGQPGADGHTPVITIGSNGNWFVDGVDTGIKAQGEKGDKGDTGAQGEKGDKGDTGAQGEKGEKGDTGAQGEKGEKGDTGAQGEKGDSAYELFIKYHPNYTGSEEDWINDVAMGNKCNLFGHTLDNEWTIDYEATCTITGLKSHHCLVCGSHIDETIIEIVEHEWDDGTFESGTNGNGVYTYNCKNCSATKSISTSDVWSGLSYAPSETTIINDTVYYLIKTPEELAYLSNCEERWLKYNYLLVNDIVLNSSQLVVDENGELISLENLNEWIPIGGDDYYGTSFTGIFDGGGHTIFGLYTSLSTNRNGMSHGFIRAVSEGKIKNLNFSNVWFGSGWYSGVICGSLNYGEMTNCSVSGNVIATTDYTGGLVGKASRSVISDCVNNSNIYVKENCTVRCCGGIIGVASSSIINCNNFGNIYGYEDVGGIAGYCGDIVRIGEIINSNNYGNVYGTKEVGGISGATNKSELDNCNNYGNVYGDEEVGGIAGNGYDTFISSCVNEGIVSGTNYVGGIVGNTVQSISNCENKNDVSGTNYVGGIVGYTDCENYGLRDSCNYCNVIGSTNVGAIAGYLDILFSGGTISNLSYKKNSETNYSILGVGSETYELQGISFFD